MTNGSDPLRDDAFDVLVLDDHQDIRELLVAMFESEGWRARSATTVGDAEVALRERLPDLVVSELRVIGFDSGTTFADRLRNDPSTRHIVRIAITSRVRPGIDAAFDGCLSKPFALPELLSLITQFAATIRTRRERTSPGES